MMMKTRMMKMGAVRNVRLSRNGIVQGEMLRIRRHVFLRLGRLVNWQK